MSLYYEAHVTIEPVAGQRLDKFGEICERHGFRVAELLMKKREGGLERSPYDSFCTGRSAKYGDLEARMLRLLLDLRQAEFCVWRYKIEDTILDSRSDDTLFKVPKNPRSTPRTRWPEPTD